MSEIYAFGDSVLKGVILENDKYMDMWRKNFFVLSKK